jgi:hypothetical protein
MFARLLGAVIVGLVAFVVAGAISLVFAAAFVNPISVVVGVLVGAAHFFGVA